MLVSEGSSHSTKQHPRLSSFNNSLIQKFLEHRTCFQILSNLIDILRKLSAAYGSAISEVMEYQKRPGTSGIDGQLYETKLLAMILFKLQHDPKIQHFNLATNINDLGDFDDICLAMKIKGHDRPVAIFMQLKHKDNDNAVIKFENKDKVKYVNSYIKIKEKIASQQACDNFFSGDFTETDFFIILYTNAKFSITNSESKFENSYFPILNGLLVTTDTVGCHAQDSEGIVEDLAEIFLDNELTLLVEHFAEFLIDKGTDRSMHIMNDEYIQQYHVILRGHVVDISDIQTDEHELDLKWRTLTFQQDFFTTDDKHTSIFRDQLYKEWLKKQRKILFQESKASQSLLDETITVFLSNPSVDTLTPLILTHLDCNKAGKLEFLLKRSSSDVELLQQMNIPRQEIQKAMFAAKRTVRECLQTLELKVPSTFGNVDLVLRGSENKINRRLRYLSTALDRLCKEYVQRESHKIVKIDDRLGDGLLSHNGGLASTVGNMLTYDKKTNMLKFSNVYTLEQKTANKLFVILKELIDDIFQYRFIVKTKRLPKLHFDCTDTAREFLHKLIIYEKQGNHWKVEEILKEKIEQQLSVNSRVVKSSQIGVSVFLHYHEEILKWWMSPTPAAYLTKTSNLYELAIHNWETEPQITALHSLFYISKIKYFRYRFAKNTSKWIELLKLSSNMFITTDAVALMTVKAIQCLRYHFMVKKFAVLDLDFVMSLPNEEFNSLNMEVNRTEKVLIIVSCNKQNNSNLDKRFSSFAQSTKEKQLIVIINSKSEGVIKEHLCRTNDVFYNETLNLSDLELQKDITKDFKVIFQGQETGLDLILDDEAVAFITGSIIDKMICNEAVNIGKPLSNTQYEGIKGLYIDRRVSQIYDSSSDEDSSQDGDRISDDLDNIPNRSKNIFGDFLGFTYNTNNEGGSFSDYEYTLDDYEDTTFNNEILVKTFLDIQNNVVLLTAPPGMGKSTLLTHLSLNTKQHDVKLWVVRMNFIDYSKQFQEWYEDEVVVDTLECLKLLCEVILINNTISFEVDIANGKARLTNCVDDELAAFELNMFLHFYNHRKLIFVFDGFDEICPYYKDKVITFLTVAKITLQKYKMWVTSRPYSNILPDLEIVLGRHFNIKLLNFKEQETYLKRYWQKKLLCKELTDKQLNNLRTFIENTGQTISEARSWVRRIYSVFLDTIRPLLRDSASTTIIDKLNTSLNTCRKKKLNGKVHGLSAIPLLLYFLADYFTNIPDFAKNRSKSCLKINLHNIYEMFIENKVKTVLFQDKNKMDLSNTITRRLIEKELNDCISLHKKLAAFSFYENLTFQQLNLEEFKEMIPFNEEDLKIELNEIKTGKEKVGLISHVAADNFPVFIHRSFTEYFIAEYISDILKSHRFNKHQKTLWYCVITEGANTAVNEWIEMKKKSDPTFRQVITEVEDPLPIYKTIYRLYFDGDNMSKSHFIRILASSVNDYADGCFNDFLPITKYIDKSDARVKQELIAYFQHYFISKMKPHLKRHFKLPILFKLRTTKDSFVRDFVFAKCSDKTDGILIKLKILGRRLSDPLFILLIQQDNCHNFQTSDTVFFEEKLQDDDDNVSDYLFIQYLGCDFCFVSEASDFFVTTRTIGKRLYFSEQHVEDFGQKILEKELTLLARALEMFLKHKEDIPIDITFMTYIKKYHVILRQQIFDISDIKRDKKQPDRKWRSASFRDDFFYNNDTNVVLFRNCLFDQMLCKDIHNIIDHLIPDQLIALFLSEPSIATLTPLLGAYIVGYEHNNLKFLIRRPLSDVEQLQQIYIAQSAIDEAKLAVRTALTVYLKSLQQKVSLDFGNIDFICGDFQNIQEKIEYVKTEIVDLCKKSTKSKMVAISDTLPAALLGARGGLPSCVGNILIYDEQTKMLKISDFHQFTSAQENAKSLYLKLSRELNNLHEYRFEVTTTEVPKYRLSYTDTARQFLNRLVIFAEQNNNYKIEEILMKDNKHSFNIDPCRGLVESNLVLLHYHNEALKWRTTFKADDFVSKMHNLYEVAMKNIKMEPLLSELYTSFYFNYLKYFGYNLSENSTKSIEIPIERSKLFIVTETVILTTVKVLQRLKSFPFDDAYVVLDLKDVFTKFLSSNHEALWAELRDTTKVLIIVCTESDCTKFVYILHEVAKCTRNERMIILANTEFRATIESRFVWSDVVCINETESLYRLYLP